MAFSTCFRRQGIISTFLYQRLRVALIPTIQTNVLTNGSIFKTSFTRSKMTPIYNPVKLLSTSIVRRHEEKPHDHAKLWIVEKGTTACLVVLIPLGLLIPNRLFDTFLAIFITAHTHWGLEACVVEYVRVLLFGPTLPKVAMGVVYGTTALMLGGLLFLNFNDIGLCRGFWRIWRNMRKPADSPRRGVGPGGSRSC